MSNKIMYIIVAIIAIVLLIKSNDNKENMRDIPVCNRYERRYRFVPPPEQLWNNPTRINYYSYDIRDLLDC